MSAAGTGGAPDADAPPVSAEGEPGASEGGFMPGFGGAAVAVGVDAAVSLEVEEGASGIATSFNDAAEAVGMRAEEEEVPSSPFESFFCCVDEGAPVFARLWTFGCSLSDGERERLRVPSAGPSAI